MSAPEIARVCADLFAGHVDTPDGVRMRAEWVTELLASAAVIDATGLYESLEDDEINQASVPAGYCLAPPWRTALIAYRNEYGHVIVCHVVAYDRQPDDTYDQWDAAPWEGPPGRPITDVEWERVRWQLAVSVYLGGMWHREPARTTGPLHIWRVAVYDSGDLADARWVQMHDSWDHTHAAVAGAVWVRALNFLNCRNVEMVEPVRHRAEARRLARTGVRVHELTVRPVGRSSQRDSDRPAVDSFVPLHSVRGHFANYGTDGRGLLFGKLAGRYWIPQHARGHADNGVIDQRFTIEPGES